MRDAAVLLVASLVAAAVLGARALPMLPMTLATGDPNGTLAYAWRMPFQCTELCGFGAPCMLASRVAQMKRGDVLCVNPFNETANIDMHALRPAMALRAVSGEWQVTMDTMDTGPWYARLNPAEYLTRVLENNLTATELADLPYPLGAYEVPGMVLQQSGVVIQSAFEDVAVRLVRSVRAGTPIQARRPAANSARAGTNSSEGGTPTARDASSQEDFAACSLFVIMADGVTLRRLDMQAADCTYRRGAVDNAAVVLTTAASDGPGVVRRRVRVSACTISGAGGAIIWRTDSMTTQAVDLDGSIVSETYLFDANVFHIGMYEGSGTLFVDFKNTLWDNTYPRTFRGNVLMRGTELPGTAFLSTQTPGYKAGVIATQGVVSTNVSFVDIAALNYISRSAGAFDFLGARAVRACVHATQPGMAQLAHPGELDRASYCGNDVQDLDAGVDGSTVANIVLSIVCVLAIGYGVAMRVMLKRERASHDSTKKVQRVGQQLRTQAATAAGRRTATAATLARASNTQSRLARRSHSTRVRRPHPRGGDATETARLISYSPRR